MSDALATASGLINGPRAARYGHPLDNFERIGRGWGVILKGESLSPEVVALMLIWLKVARAVEEIEPDTIVDIAGYAGCIELIQLERERRTSVQSRSQTRHDTDAPPSRGSERGTPPPGLGTGASQEGYL